MKSFNRKYVFALPGTLVRVTDGLRGDITDAGKYGHALLRGTGSLVVGTNSNGTPDPHYNFTGPTEEDAERVHRALRELYEEDLRMPAGHVRAFE